MSAEPITDLATAVEVMGALPMPAGPAPQPATPRWHQARTELISTFRDYMPETAATKAVDLLDEVIAEALLEGTAESKATSQPDETEYAVRMPGSNDVWPRREFRMGHWERVLREGGVLLERVIRRGPWTEAPNQCPGFEGNPVAPDQCAGCGETNDAHEEAGR